MAHIQLVDELVREYLLYRGFTTSVKSFDSDLKSDKDKGFRVDKIVEQLLHCINTFDFNALKEYWTHLDSLVLSKLENHFAPAVRKIEYGLYKLYLVTAVNAGKAERINEFLTKMTPEIQGHAEWREWFMLPYVQKPEDNPVFSLYFTRQWQDTLIVSLHNFLATIFQCMPQPTLTNYESDAAVIKRLQEENAILKSKMSNQSAASDKSTPFSHQSRLTQYSERLNGPVTLMDDFYVIPTENLESGVREAKGLRGLIRQMGGSPVLGRIQSRPSSQN